jgi:hypothetical protein
MPSGHGDDATAHRRGGAGAARRLTFANDEACDLIISVASGEIDSVEQIAGRLRPATQPWP